MTLGRLGGMRTLLILLIGTLSIACSPATSAAPSTAAVTSPDPTTQSPPTSAPSPTSSPTQAPTSSVTPPPSTAPPFAACALPTWHDALPSGRLVDVKTTSTAIADIVTFKFEAGGDNPGTPTGTITAAKPPFSESASGKPIDVAGDQFLQVRFENMTLEDASGPVYAGKTDITADGGALRQVVNDDAYEGYSGWIVGLDKPTCVSVDKDKAGLALTLTIRHP
jgi:hypothetical protein